jgi:putative sigma-54 modulation protein
MQINLSGQHFEITPALHDYVNEKIPKLSRFFDPIPLVHLVLKVEKMQHIAEATLQANGEDLHATAKEATMMAAVDSLIDKLVRLLKKHKEKHYHH